MRRLLRRFVLCSRLRRQHGSLVRRLLRRGLLLGCLRREIIPGLLRCLLGRSLRRCRLSGKLFSSKLRVRLLLILGFGRRELPLPLPLLLPLPLPSVTAPVCIQGCADYCANGPTTRTTGGRCCGGVANWRRSDHSLHVPVREPRSLHLRLHHHPRHARLQHSLEWPHPPAVVLSCVLSDPVARPGCFSRTGWAPPVGCELRVPMAPTALAAPATTAARAPVLLQFTPRRPPAESRAVYGRGAPVGKQAAAATAAAAAAATVRLLLLLCRMHRPGAAQRWHVE